MGQPLDINLPPDELKKAIAEALNNKMDYGVFYQNPKYPNRRNWQGEFEVKVGDSVSIKWNPKLKEGYIDIEGAPGKNMKDLFSDFDKVRDGLPEGRFLMSPGEAKDAAGNVVGRKALKHKLYAREFKNDSQITLNEDLNLRNRPGGSQESFTLDTTKPRNIDPWTVRNDIYTLTDDSSKNRRLLEDHLTTKIKKGYKPKGILYGKDKTPHRLSTKSIERVLDPNDSLDKINIKKSNTGKPSPRTYWGKSQASMEDQIKYTKRVRDDLVNKFLAGSKLKPITKMHGHHVRMLQMYSPFFEGLNDVDIAELAKFAAKRFPLGDVKANIALLDEDFHNQLHNFMREKGYQLRSGVAKGTPDLGNTLESRKAALTHFFDNVQEPIEKELSRVRWDQQAKYNPLSNDEVLNQLNWMNSSEYAAEVKAAKLRGEITEVGRRLGGIGDTFNIAKRVWKQIPVPVKFAGALGITAITDVPDVFAGGHGVVTSKDSKKQAQHAFQMASGLFGAGTLLTGTAAPPAAVFKGTELAIANRRKRDADRLHKQKIKTGETLMSGDYSHSEENPVEIKPLDLEEERIDKAMELQINR